jgi:hypothetical protein
MRTFTRTPTFTGADGPARGEVRGRRESNPVPMLSTKTQKRSRTPHYPSRTPAHLRTKSVYRACTRILTSIRWSLRGMICPI